MSNQPSEWFIINDQNEQEGPLSALSLQQLFAMGRIGPNTLVWREGLTDWSTYEREFGSLPAATPERSPAEIPLMPSASRPKPQSDALSRFFGGSCRPWRRWFARFIDLNLFGNIVGILVLFLLFVVAPSAASSVRQYAANQFIDGAVLLLLWMPFECVCIAAFGSTPGKWLLGIRITNQDDAPLNFLASVKRYVGMMVQGAGFGLPIVVFFTYILSYRRLTSTGTTAWDSATGTKVTVRHMTGLKYTIATLAVFFSLCFIVFLRMNVLK